MTDEAARIPALYERHALAFDRLRGKTLHEKPWLQRFMAHLPPDGAVLDIGCGSGEPMAAALLSEGYAVTGIDSAPTLIGLCRSRFPQGKWHVGDMRDLALGQRFDGLLAWHSFFHLTAGDQRRMFPLFAAHAKPGAVLMFTCGPGEGVVIGAFEGEALYHASLSGDDYRDLLAAHGFAVLDHRIEDADCGGATVWLARRH